MSDLFEILDDLNFNLIIKDFSPLKQRIVKALVSGDNFNQIGIREGIDRNRIYKIKDELAEDFAGLKKESGWREARTPEDDLLVEVKKSVSKMPLSRFTNLYLSQYCKLGIRPIQRWEKGEEVEGRDRIIVTISFLIRELFIRQKPVVLDYYYSNRESLVKLIQLFKLTVKQSPLVHDCLEVLRTDADLGIKLKDGSQVRTIWSGGKQPKESGTLIIVDYPVNNPKITIV